MQTDFQAHRPSFFDDDDLSIGFDFTMPNKSIHKDLNLPARVKDTLIKQIPNLSVIDEGFYSLHNKTLVRYKNSSAKTPVAVLDVCFAKLQMIVPPSSDCQSHYGFSLTKNGVTHEFYHPGKPIIEDWYEALKDVCVLNTFHDDYKALKMIGKGSFAKVYLVESKQTGKSFAVKAFTKESVIHANKENAKPSMLNEINIMRAIDHENVIKIYEIYETEKSIYLVLELIQGKSLQDILKKPLFKEEYSEIKITNMIRSILDALAYLASKGVMHRDLKPDNILLDKEMKIKIVDFGLATFIDVPEYIFKKCGTPGYIAPEVFKYDQKNPLTHYDHRCDVFSAGCIFYYMLFGTPFFGALSASEILRANRKFSGGDFKALNNIKKELQNPNSKISADALNLLQNLTEFNPKARFTADQSLSHPYFIPVPTGMYKVCGSNDIVPSDYDHTSEPHSPLSPNSPDWHRGSDTSSPRMSLLSPTKSNPNPFKLSPICSDFKQRFEKRDSLYLDMGKTEFNGRTDTINTGLSSNNSLLLLRRSSNASNASGSNSGSASGLSKFSPGGRSKSIRISTGAFNHDLLKQTIIRNMQRNFSDIPKNPETEEGELSTYHSAGLPDRALTSSPLSKYRDSSVSQNNESEDESSTQEPAPVVEGGFSEKMKEVCETKSQSQSQSPRRRFHPFAQKRT